MTDILEVAQCISCQQWRAADAMRMVTVKPQEQVGYACKACYLAMQRPN